MKKILKLFGGDKVIWVMLVILTVYSVLAVTSSIVSLSYNEGKSIASLVMRHVIFLAFGWGVTYVVHLFPPKLYIKFAPLLLIIAVGLLIYTLIWGVEINESKRWIDVGGFYFQTSDYAKIALIIFVARFLSSRQDEIRSFKRGFLPVLLAVLVICALIQSENLSTALIIFTVSMILLYIGRVRLRYIIALLLAGFILGGSYFLITDKPDNKSRKETWEERLKDYMNPDPIDNPQPYLAKIAISNGGLIGKFAGHSTQKHSLPQAYSDFIFAIIIEEYGLFFGALPLVFLYIILLFRAGVIVKNSDRTFPAFLAIGLSLGIVIQALVHMGVAVGIFPVTGQTLPWISRGGSSILFTAIAFGIILGVSRSLEDTGKEAVSE